MKPPKVEAIIAAELPRIKNLECDGTTRVLHYALNKAGIPHKIYTGDVTFNGKVVPLHFWIKLPDGRIIDYKLRMWIGNSAPEGIFEPKGIEYNGVEVDLPVNEMLYQILTSTFAEGGQINGLTVYEAVYLYAKRALKQPYLSLIHI